MYKANILRIGLSLPLSLPLLLLSGWLHPTDFPIAVWSGDGRSSCNDLDMLPLVSDLHANIMLHELDFFDSLDEGLQVLELAGNYEIKIIVRPNWARYRWIRAQHSLYSHATDLQFDHQNVIGEWDPESQAWRSPTENSEAGWLQKGLVENYQQGYEWWSGSRNYIAAFRLKVSDNTNHSPAATLYAVGVNQNLEQEL